MAIDYSSTDVCLHDIPSPCLWIPCFECGAPSTYNHHVIPRAQGGTKTVPLCADCHGLIHGITFTTHHPTLVRQGLARARASGKTFGRPSILQESDMPAIRAALAGGMAKAALCRTWGVKRTTLYDALARWP